MIQRLIYLMLTQFSVRYYLKIYTLFKRIQVPRQKTGLAGARFSVKEVAVRRVKVKVKGRVRGLFGTAACRPIVPLLTNEFPSFISTHHIGTRDLC